jgi:MYXO-CTERM domain-containing protein
MGLVLVVLGGLALVVVAAQFNLFGINAESVSRLPVRPLVLALAVLTLIWLRQRRAKWR